MKKYKKLLILSALFLTACGGSGTSSFDSGTSPSSSDSPSSIESGDYSSFSSSFEDLVPSEFVEKLNGTYYGKEGTISVTDDSVIFNDTTFSMSKRIIESFDENGEKIDHAVTYLRDGQDEYRIYLSGNGRYTLHLDKKENGEFVLVDSFMPSIEEFTGAYSAFGDGDIYNSNLHLGNNFNYYYGSFDIGYYLSTFGFRMDIYYANSYYIYFNNELTKLITINDYADNYEFYAVILGQTGDTIGLIDPNYYTGTEYDWYDFIYDPLCLSYNYFSNDDSILYSYLDVTNSKVTINEVEYDYSVSFDRSKGQVFSLTAEGKEIKVYPNQYGMTWEENGESKQYVYDTTDSLFGIFSYEDINFEYKYDDETFEPTVFINGSKFNHAYEIYNNSKAIKVTFNNEDYYFAPFKGNIALLVGTKDGELFFINKNEFVNIYSRTFINKVDDSYKEMNITEDFKVVYEGKICKANLYYTPSVAYPYLEFTINEKAYQFTLLQKDIGAASLTFDDKTEYFFDKEVIAGYYGDYTFHHEIDLILSEYELDYFGESVNYTIEPYYYAYSFIYLLSIRFEVNNQEIVAFLANEMMAMDVKDESGTTTTKTCIKYSYFSDLIGEYYFEGKYGPEKFKLTEDGNFYADTEKSSKDGLIYDVEYDYSLQMTKDAITDEPLPSLIFHVTDLVGIQLVKIGHTMVVGSTVYTAKYLFDFNGVYVDETNSTVIEIREDSLFVNGEEKEITSISYDEYGTTISTDINGSEVTYYFMKNGDEYYVSSDENFYTEYTRYSFDFDLLIGTYEFESTTYTLSKGINPLTGIEYGYSFTDGFFSTTEYSVVLKDGKVALEFKLLSDTIYIYNDGEGNVIEVVKPSLPPVPPPPPPPPAPPII